MKTSDFLVLGGIGALAYMLLAKPKEAEAKAPGVSIIPIPTPGEAPGVAGILESLKGLIGQAPTIPTIITMPSLGIGEQGPSEWDIWQMFQGWTEQFDPGLDLGLSELDIEKLIQDALNKFLPTEEQEPTGDGVGVGAGGAGLLERLLFGQKGLGLEEGLLPGVPVVLESISESSARVGKEVATYITQFGGGLEAISKTLRGEPLIPGWTTWPWGKPWGKETEYTQERAKEVFGKAGISGARFEAMTIPEREAFFAGEDETEAKATERYPGYREDMELLAESAPYLLSEAELERYG